jgi:hypothetical protein
MKSQRTNANIIDDLEVGRLVHFDHRLSLKVREKAARPVGRHGFGRAAQATKISGSRWSGDD